MAKLEAAETKKTDLEDPEAVPTQQLHGNLMELKRTQFSFGQADHAEQSTGESV